ncbi:MAG: hypothetical protein GX575_17975 [Candidatus Anammoximicrobium sp.]|nr:hypothetical protein [Candidatus Anammoximicrobium sp.]
MRKLSDYHEVVGIAESDPELRKRREKDPAYRDLTGMTEESPCTQSWSLKNRRSFGPKCPIRFRKPASFCSTFMPPR